MQANPSLQYIFSLLIFAVSLHTSVFLQASSQSQSEKKTSFPMNPNANVFQSQIYNQNEEGVDEDETGDNKSNDTSSFQGKNRKGHLEQRWGQLLWKVIKLPLQLQILHYH